MVGMGCVQRENDWHGGSDHIGRIIKIVES